MTTIVLLVLLTVGAVAFWFVYRRYGDNWRILWRRQKLRRGYNTFYSFKGDCKVTTTASLDWTVSVCWISRYKVLIYDVVEPVIGDLICLRSQATSQDPWVYSWYALIATRNFGADDMYMYGTTTFITFSDTEELPF